MRVYRTRHTVYADDAPGFAWFDCEPPEPGARPVGLPHWGTRGDIAWQTWWSGEKPNDE